MPNLNELVVRTAKLEGSTQESIVESLKEAYADFRISKLYELDEEWEAVLEKPLDKKSSRVRVSEFPFKEKGESEGESEGGESESDDDGDSEDSESDSDSEGGSEGGEKGKGDFGGGEGGSPLKSIEHLLSELEHEVKRLKDKADVVDNIHHQIKPHVEEMGGGGLEGPELGGPPGGAPGEGMGPGGPGGMGGPGGPAPGFGGPGGPPGKPPVPRGPNPSHGFDRRVKSPSRGMPATFTSDGTTRSKIVFTPIYQDGYKFELGEATQAMANKYPTYRLAAVQEDLPNNRYVGKLLLK